MDPKTGTKLRKTEVKNEINKFVDDAESETDDLDDMYDEFGKFFNYFSKSDLSIYLI